MTGSNMTARREVSRWTLATMRTLAVVLGATLLAASLFIGSVAAGGVWKAPPFSSIGIKTVGPIDNSFVPTWSSGDYLRFFIETGSTRSECLLTLAESTDPNATQMYCGYRQMTISDTVRDGLLISINLSEALPVGGYYVVNVYQEGAQYYGDPVPHE